MNAESLEKDLKVLRTLVPKFSRIPYETAVWPSGDRLTVQAGLTTMMATPEKNVLLMAPVSIHELYQVLQRPEIRRCDSLICHHLANDPELAFVIDGQDGKVEIPRVDIEAPRPPHPGPYSRRAQVEIKADALEFVSRAMCTDEARFALGGVLIDGENRRIVASDGKRLHHRPFTSDKEFGKILIPAHAVRALVAAQKRQGRAPIIRLAVPEHEPKVAPEYISLETGRFEIQTKQIEGRFPDWKAILPKGYNYTLSLDAAELRAVLKLQLKFLRRTQKEAKDKGNKVVDRVEFRLGQRSLLISAMTEGHPTSEYRVAVRSFDGREDCIQGIGVNVDYLLDASWNDTVTYIQGTNQNQALMIDGSSLVMPLLGSSGSVRYDKLPKEGPIRAVKGDPFSSYTWRTMNEELKKEVMPVQQKKPSAPRLKVEVRPMTPKPVARKAPREMAMAHTAQAVAVAAPPAPPPAAAPSPAPPAVAPKPIGQMDFNLFS